MTCRKVVRSRHYYYTQCDIYVNTPRTHTHTLTQPENIDTIRSKLKIIRKKRKKKKILTYWPIDPLSIFVIFTTIIKDQPLKFNPLLNSFIYMYTNNYGVYKYIAFVVTRVAIFKYFRVTPNRWWLFGTIRFWYGGTVIVIVIVTTVSTTSIKHKLKFRVTVISRQEGHHRNYSGNCDYKCK